MSAATPAVSPASRDSRRLVLLLLLVASAGYVARTAITVVAPGIMAAFSLSQTQMGQVFSAFLVGYTALQMPSGWLADRISARWLFFAQCVGWMLLTLATAAVGWHGIGAALPLALLMGVRGLFGIVAAPTYPASARTVALWVAPAAQARANGMVLASIGVGSAVTPLLLGPIVEHQGWRAALVAAAAVSALAGVLWWRFAPQPHSPGAETPGKALPGPAHSPDDASSWRSPSFWFLSASYFLQGYVGYIFVFWFYLYLLQVRHFAVLQAASLTALPWLATLFGIPLGGVVSDLAVRRWGATMGRRSLPLAALCAAALFLVVGARSASAGVAVACLTVCTVLVLSTEGPFWATLNQVAGARSGVAGGVMNFGSNLGGMISPALTPWLAERIGWDGALSLAAALSALAGLLWLGVRLNGEKLRVPST